MMSFCSKIQ